MEYLKNLNPEQMEAVSILDGPVLVIAGAGSGKTRVVTTRIIYMLKAGISPSQILGLTFTNKAAGEMKERVQKQSACNVLISTFHSLGARILRESIHVMGYSRDFAIYDEEDSGKLLASILESCGVKEKKGGIRAWRSLISKAKNELQDPDSINVDELPDAQQVLFPKVYRAYLEQLKGCNALDFDDLLYLPLKLFQEHPEVLEKYQNRWTHLLIDEYQDTNEAQYAFVKLLVQKSRNLFVVGDPDQAIYSWRGANIRNILSFEKDYPGAQVIRLEQNYRSRITILNAANALISQNSNRLEKRLWSDRGEGEKIGRYSAYNDREEARFVATRIRTHRNQGVSLNEVVVFYRTNAQSRPFEDQFLSLGLPYIIVGGVSFYQRKEIKDILAYLRLILSDQDAMAFSRVLNVPKRGIGDVTLGKIMSLSQIENIPILEVCRGLFNKTTYSIPVTLSAKAKEALKEFIAVIDHLREVSKECSLERMIKEVIEKTNYLIYLKEDKDTFDDRKENLNELIVKGIEWDLAHEEPSLTHFLEELSLKSNLDILENADEKVSLMTLHNGKGLEFDLAFIVGLEEDLLPHANSRESQELLEEERRLCYVGMTRAKEYLYLTDSQMRYLWGSERFQRPSRFLKEIPPEYIKRMHG
jgi:DNA helicase-2/ATP-dependent DNA helicase PcrA